MKRWPTKPLGEICDLVNGAPFKPSDWDGSGLPIIRIQNLNDRTKPFNYTSTKVAEKFRVKAGDTLLSWSGTPGTSFGCFRWDGPEGWLNQHIFNVHLVDEVLPPFFIYQVNSKLEELIGKAHGGVGLQHITKGALSSVNIAVPPLAEQERIVNLLDEADELRKLRDQADQHTAALIPALFHEMFGDPLSPSSKWTRSTLAEACLKLTDGTHFSPPAVDKGVPYITAKHLRDYGLDFDRNPTFVSIQDHHEIYARCDPKQGDVLYIKDGATTGLAAINNYDFEFSMLSSLAMLRPDPSKCTSEYLCCWLNNQSVKAAMLEQMAGAAIKRLTLTKLNRAPILLPPLTLQKEFAIRVTEIRAMQAEQAASRRRLDDLFKSMLHRAFRGELTSSNAQEFRLTGQQLETQELPRRAAIACYIVDRLHSSPTFGRTQLMKGLYLAETYAQVDLQGEYERQAAGPFDKSIYEIEDEARAEKWFAARETRTQQGHTKISYSLLNGINQKVTDAVGLLGNGRDKLDHVLALFKQRTTKDVEILTTLYAAWNDLLIAGRRPTDDKLVHEVLENWHEDKKQIPETRWRKEIQWMRANSFVPKGNGRSTRLIP